jgi:serine/threonine protein kinase
MPSRKRRKQSSSDSNDEPTEKILKKEDDLQQATKNLYWPFEHPAVLGKGSFGNVQIWHHHSKGILCAAKSFRVEADFRHELERVRDVDHENVVKCLGSYDDQRVILYNLCSTTLKEMLEEDAANHFGIGETSLRLLVKHMMSAQDYLVHRLRIVHRDLKPANILYDDRRKLFILADLGMATPFDPETSTYKDFVRGTPNFMRPDVRAKIKKVEQFEFSINSEIWSLAVTIFVAATGRYPFKTKTRNKSVELARDKPVGSFWIDKDDETYMTTLRGYNRLSREFQSDVLSPLLVYMMSADADFAGMFALVERYKLDRDLLFVFDVHTLVLRSLPCRIGRDNLLNVLMEADLGRDGHMLVHDGGFVEEGKTSIPRTTEDAPIICCKNRFENDDGVVLGLAESLYGTAEDFFAEVHVRFYEKDVHCVFSNVAERTESCRRRLEFVKTFARTYADSVRNRQVELACLSECLERDAEELFRIHKPTEEFAGLVSQMRLRKEQALLPVTFRDQVNISDNECVSSFNQHVAYLNQRKFSANRKEHVLRVKKAMDLLRDAVTSTTRDFASSFGIWQNEITTRCEDLKRLLSETAYAQKELNKNLIREIETFT